ncbi:MAG: DoxX family protein [Nibricoccus sp.]
MQIKLIRSRIERMADFGRSPLLLILRLFWGLQLVQTGWGKLVHFDRTAGFFESLGIPAPHLNAAMAGGTEMVGGLLLALGLWARLASIPVIFVMAVAYVTAEREALRAITTEPDKFTSAAPFLFLFVALVVVAFGPGAFSVDRLLNRETPVSNA